MKTAHRHATVLALVTALAALLPALASAQAIYRIVGPDGRVSFSDKPPVSADEKATALSSGGRSAAGGSGELPFELRQLISRYPVTLYTGDNCEPCNAGRSLLNNRGIPFSERTVKTPMDVQALQQLSGGATVPVLTIGGQRIKGFLNADWNQYLDAAGYSNSSRLPTSYRNPPASPLAPMSETPSASAQPAPPPPPVQEAAPPEPAAPSPNNPTGIVF